MKIKQDKKFLNVTIFDESDLFYYFQSLIDKNFKNKLGKKDKIVIFNDKSEWVQKRYFLKLLSRIYAKKTGKKRKKIWQIEKAIDKAIKIRLIKEKQLQKIVHIDIDFDTDKGLVILKMDSKNRVVVRGVKNLFKNYQVFYNPSIESITIGDLDKEFLPIFEDFISIGEIFDNFLRYDYKIGIFFDIDEYIKSKKSKKRKGLEMIMGEFYQLLECDFNDPYEKIRKSYLNLAKKYHPDNVDSDNNIILKVYGKKFQKIQKAYETIKEYHKYSHKVA